MIDALEIAIVCRFEVLDFFRAKCKTRRGDAVTYIKINEPDICFYKL